MLAGLPAFLGVSLLIIVVPGADTALTIRNALVHGRRDGMLTALGVASGQAIWAACTAAGIGSLVAASQPALAALRIAGAAYLAYLGLRALAAAIRQRGTPPELAPAAARLTAYRQGLLSNLANPKMVVFFLSLLPQFTGPGAAAPRLLVLGLVFCSLTLGWLALYSVVVARFGDVLRRSAIRRAIDTITGAALLAFGIRLATERH